MVVAKVERPQVNRVLEPGEIDDDFFLLPVNRLKLLQQRKPNQRNLSYTYLIFLYLFLFSLVLQFLLSLHL